MKKKTKLIIIIAVAIVVIVAAVLGVLMLLDNGHRVIKVVEYEGDVKIERDSDDIDIFEGMKLVSEDEITTEDNSSVSLLADEDKYILARENACFTIISEGDEKQGRLRIKLEYGQTLIDIENKLPDDYDFEVKTPNATLSVRGTTFEVSYDPQTNTTIVNVTDGEVKVESDSDSATLSDGENAIITNDNLIASISGNENPDDNENSGNNVNIPISEELSYTNETAFEIKHGDTKAGSGIYVKQLRYWEYEARSVDGSMYDEYVKDGVRINYSIQTAVNNIGGETIEVITNADGEEIITHDYYLYDISNPLAKIITMYKEFHLVSEPENTYYIQIMIYDEQFGEALGKDTKPEEYLDLTRNVYFFVPVDVMFPSDSQHVNVLPPLPEDSDIIPLSELSNYLAGGIDLYQLQYVLGIYQTCKEEYDMTTEYEIVDKALEAMWHHEGVAGVYTPVSYNGNQRIYSLEELDNLYDIFHIETFADYIGTLHEYVRIEGEDVIFDEMPDYSINLANCTVMSAKLIFGDNDVIQINGKYRYYYDDTRKTGIEGDMIVTLYKEVMYIDMDVESVFRIGEITYENVIEFNNI